MDEDKVQPPKEEQKPTKDAGQPKPKPPVTPMDVDKVHPPTHSNDSHEHKKKGKRKPLTCAEIWGIVLAIIGLLVAAGTGAAIVWQDYIASSTLVELQKQYPELKKSADAAYDSVKSAKAANQLDERAWINPSVVVLAPKENVPVLASLTIIDTGKTPAQKVRIYAQVEKLKGTQPPSFDYTYSVYMESNLLFPNAPAGAQPMQFFQQTKSRKPILLTTADIEDIYKGGYYIAVFAKVSYRDIYGNRRWIHFCGWDQFTPGFQPPAAKACVEYNDGN